MPEVPLKGCTPEPLMSYLKALGVLRLVSEQADREARGYWRNDEFVLHSELDKDATVKFFLNEYRPTPIVAPWNGGSGFYRKWDPDARKFKARDVVEALDAISHSTSSRLGCYRNLLQSTNTALGRLGRSIDLPAELKKIENEAARENWSTQKRKGAIKKFLDSLLLCEVNGQTVCLEKEDKDEFLKELRSKVLDDEALGWVDAAIVLLTGQGKNRTEAPVLGSGGNIGNSDFSSRFMQLLPTVMPLVEGMDVPLLSLQYLRSSLFGDPASQLSEFSVDQFDPGRAGSANMGQGLAAKPLLNPWDYVLMIEGSLLLGGAVTKRLGAFRQAAAFPFCSDSSSVGFASAGNDETRGELWLPVWDRHCSIGELKVLFGEGRAEVGKRQARTGVDFARAAASLGVDRGVSAFVRYEFQKRLGDNYLANSLGRFEVRRRESVDLLRELDPSLDRFRSACGDKDAPSRFKAALRSIEEAVFDFCRYGGVGFFQTILVAIGKAERELALSEGRITKKRRCDPIAGLSPNWITEANDSSAEFELALALAGIFDPDGKVGPLRSNLEPVTIRQSKNDRLAARWAERERAAVWNSARLPVNLVRVLARRLMDGDKEGCEKLPLASSNSASLSTISQFLAGELADGHIENLLWGLALIDKKAGLVGHAPPGVVPPLPRAYALLKLLFLSEPLQVNRELYSVKPEREIVALLGAGHIGQACRMAMRRLRASGLAPLPHLGSGGFVRDGDWEELEHANLDAHRLAAALLLPISRASVQGLCRLILRHSELERQTF